jgi:hypothetical protein
MEGVRTLSAAHTVSGRGEGLPAPPHRLALGEAALQASPIRIIGSEQSSPRPETGLGSRRGTSRRLLPRWWRLGGGGLCRRASVEGPWKAPAVLVALLDDPTTAADDLPLSMTA